MRLLLASSALVLAFSASALAKPPPGTLPGPEHSWWEAQRSNWGASCCGAPGSDGHVLRGSEWGATGDSKFPYWVLLGATVDAEGSAHGGRKVLVPARVVEAPQDLPEPNAWNAARAKAWYAVGTDASGHPYVTWYCFQPVEGE